MSVKPVFLVREICAFLTEKDKEPKWLSGLSVDSLDVASKNITVVGYLPDNLQLANFPNGSTIEFQHRPHGRINEYYPNSSFITLRNCRLTKCWIPDLLSQYPDEGQKMVLIWAVIEGDIEVINENHQTRR